jgi:hypothetical protein
MEELFDDLEDEFNVNAKKNKKPAGNVGGLKSPLASKSPGKPSAEV